jgi:hypothetical protein
VFGIRYRLPDERPAQVWVGPGARKAKLNELTSTTAPFRLTSNACWIPILGLAAVFHPPYWTGGGEPMSGAKLRDTGPMTLVSQRGTALKLVTLPPMTSGHIPYPE